LANAITPDIALFQITQFETSIMEGWERGRKYVSGGQEEAIPWVADTQHQDGVYEESLGVWEPTVWKCDVSKLDLDAEGCD